MKIMLLTTLYPEDTRSDLKKDTRAIHYFAKQWVQEGHEVVVVHVYLHPIKNILSYRPNKYGKVVLESENEGVKILLIENQLLWPHARHLTKMQQNKVALNINTYLNDKQFEPDVMLVHFPTYVRGITEKIKFACRRAAILHNADLTSVKLIKNKNKVRSMFSKYDEVGFRSEQIQAAFNSYIRLQKKNFIVHSGIPKTYIPEKEIMNNRIYRSIKEPLKIIYVGNLIPRKNVDVTIKALKELRDKLDFHLTIIGDGIELQKLKSLTVDLNLQDRIEFTGRLSRDESISKMKDADLFIMTSSSETFGLVYLEAMSQGCIVIGSRGEGIDGIITDGYNGFLVSPGYTKELSEKILSVGQMEKEEFQNVIVNSYNTVSKMTDEKMAKAYISSIENI